MSALRDLLAQPPIVLIGWTLVHFLWQGGLVALSLWVILHLLKRKSAETRYAVACTAMLVLLLCPLITFALIYFGILRRVTAYGENAVPASLAFLSNSISHLLDSPDGAHFLAALAGAWMAGVLVLFGRLLAGWLRVQRIRRSATPVSNLVFQGRLSVMALRIGLHKPVRLMESALATGPAVVGFLRPMILFPAAALTGLWPVQVEAILAHELAHIRRHDYLVNLLQSLVETLLFYHPAVWWVSARIREERENCCDDLAVKACAGMASASAGDRTFYAGCLADLDDLRPAHPSLAMGAAAGSLLGRVQRILAMPHGGSGAGVPMLGVLAITGIFLVAFAQAQDRVRHQAPAVHVAPLAHPLVQDANAVSTLNPSKQNIDAAPAPAPKIDFPTLGFQSVWNAARWVQRKWPVERAVANTSVVRAAAVKVPNPAEDVSDFPAAPPMFASPAQVNSPAPVSVPVPRPAVPVTARQQPSLQLFQNRYLVARMPLMSVSDGPIMSVSGGPIMSVSGGPIMSVQGGPIMSIRGGPTMTLSPSSLTNHSANYPNLTPTMPPMTVRTTPNR